MSRLRFWYVGIPIAWHHIMFSTLMDVETTGGSFAALSVTTLFFLAGTALFYYATRPVTFDIQNGLFWKGWNVPVESSVKGDRGKNWCRLESIHALQLLQHYYSEDTSHDCGNTKSGHFHYELNLVFADGHRLHVLGCESGGLRLHALSLSRFLQRPLWDRTEPVDVCLQRSSFWNKAGSGPLRIINSEWSMHPRQNCSDHKNHFVAMEDSECQPADRKGLRDEESQQYGAIIGPPSLRSSLRSSRQIV